MALVSAKERSEGYLLEPSVVLDDLGNLVDLYHVYKAVHAEEPLESGLPFQLLEYDHIIAVHHICLVLSHDRLRVKLIQKYHLGGIRDIQLRVHQALHRDCLSNSSCRLNVILQ